MSNMLCTLHDVRFCAEQGAQKFPNFVPRCPECALAEMKALREELRITTLQRDTLIAALEIKQQNLWIKIL